MKKILVISPHPDDESIGCGGTLIKHVADGDFVHVIFLTSGENGGHKIPHHQVKDIRESETKNALEILRIGEYEFWNEQDGKFIANDKNVERLIKKVKEFQPDIIYVTHEQEMHPDHQEAALLIRKVFNFLLDTISKPIIWMYEVWTPLQQMDYIVDISDFIEIKRVAIQAYKSQCNVLKFDEAIIGLNRYRGEMHSWPGGDYAEIFLEMKL